MPKKIVHVLVALALMLALSPSQAMAQEQVTIVESCAAVDHTPAVPVGGAPSLLILIFVLSGFNPFTGQLLTANMTGASGDVSGSGAIDKYGVVVIPVPLYQYGTHELTSFVADHPDLEHLAGVPKGGTFLLVYVDDSEPTCDEDAMRAAAKERIEASETTTTSSTSTTTSSTTSTSTTTSAAPPAATDSPEPTAAPVAAESTESSSGFPLPSFLIGFGILIALLGGWMLLQSGSGQAPPTDDT